jgi:alpha-mannosidase
MHHRRLSLALLACLLAAPLSAQTPDLTKQPTLYLVGYAHLDTQWRWEYPQTIGEFLPKTMRENFALFEKYPHYVFNFSGANRYRMMKEYFPAGYERLRGYVKAGRWFPAGSSMEESDVNSPSAESILRQVLYGNTFFRHELGRASAEYMLPDCFGFPASLPTLLAHAGIRGFSTQKLTWGSNAPAGGEGSPEATPKGTPFNVGIWEGVDGRSVIAALNPGDYSGDIRYDLTKSEAPAAVKRFIDWPKRVARNGEVSGVFADYHYYGTGDTGGSPSESSVALAEEMAARPDGALHVVSSAADQMFLDIAPSQTARLPRYRGDLELTNHSAGSLTSEAYQKRWNHENELLADAAEKASVAAMWLGARAYPQRRLNDAWALVMGGQFHDIAAGTATPKAYEYSWNDDVIAMNQFAAVLTDATESIASSLDTRAQGVPVVVYNPLNVEREDVVEVNLDEEGRAETGEGRTTALPLRSPLSPLRSPGVIGPDGKPVPAQSSNGKVVFLARVPPTGFAVYDVRSAKEMIAQTGLKVDEHSLENSRYRIKIDANGDISSILDKLLGRELLSAPMRLAFQTEKPHDWPAWNMDWDDQKQPPRGFVGGPAQVRVVENGPARAAIEITREAEGSKFVETILLAALGDAANRIEIRNAIDWRSSAAALKATFPLAASNPKATYNWEVGTIERGNDEPREFEVPSHEWIDLTDKSGAFGVTLLTGAKYGSDKPDDSTLRLSLLYTPGLGDGNGASYADQTSQDWGHHELTYGLTSHGAAWREDSGWQALRLDQPLIAFETGKHAGPLGKSFSLLRISRRNVHVLALKKAEENDDVIVRVVETNGKPAADVRLTFAAPVVEAHEVDGQERRIGSATIDDGALITAFTPYQIRTFALRLAPLAKNTERVESQAIALTADRTVVTRDGGKSAPGFDGHGRNLPAEMLPPSIAYGPIAFQTNGGAIVAHGQQIALPGGKFTRLYLLAASADGDQKATFRVDEKAADVTIEDWSGKFGQWDTRLWKTAEVQLPPRPDAPPNAPPRMRSETQYAGLTPGFIKRAPLAWFASHRHDAQGTNEPYQYSYLFAYALDLPPNAQRLTLADNDKIRILAITVSNEGPQIRPLQPLYDTLER